MEGFAASWLWLESVAMLVVTLVALDAGGCVPLALAVASCEAVWFCVFDWDAAGVRTPFGRAGLAAPLAGGAGLLGCGMKEDTGPGVGGVVEALLGWPGKRTLEYWWGVGPGL